jgi:single-strand DNA-binding protein
MIKVLLIGNLGKDAEVKTFENGGRVVNFTVASTEKGYTTKDNRQIPDKTEWVDCVIKREAMMKVADYLKKGIKVYVEGKLESREYTKDDVKRKIFEVAVSEIQLLTPKGEGSGQSAQSTPAVKDDDLPW